MKALLLLLLLLFPFLVPAQDPSTGDDLDLAGMLEESSLSETGGTTLILDNSRTKVGKDFYDLFYKHWATLPSGADTTQKHPTLPAITTGNWVITIEEIPSPGTANQILITIEDQPVWQQFVQARYELLETDALYALETVRQYLASYQEIQQQLSSQDQRGTGVY